MRLTKTTQEKLQNILKVQGFTIRYEKGNFKGGHCIVMDQRVIVINKFFPIESKVTTLIEIIKTLTMNDNLLTDDQIHLVKKIKES